jgi:hypothetical protein
MSVSHASFGLEAQRPQPLVCEAEPRTAMVIFAVVDPNGASVLQNRAVLRHAVRNACEELRQVKHRVGVVIDPKEEYLPVQIVNATNRTLRDVRRKREWIGGDPVSFRSGRREGMNVIASQCAGQSPEHIRNDSEARRCRSAHRVEWLVVITRPGRHHQSALGPASVTERLDQAERSSLNRPGGPEGRVCEQHTARRDSESSELIGQLGSAQLSRGRFTSQHAHANYPDA